MGGAPYRCQARIVQEPLEHRQTGIIQCVAGAGCRSKLLDVDGARRAITEARLEVPLQCGPDGRDLLGIEGDRRGPGVRRARGAPTDGRTTVHGSGGGSGRCENGEQNHERDHRRAGGPAQESERALRPACFAVRNHGSHDRCKAGGKGGEIDRPRLRHEPTPQHLAQNHGGTDEDAEAHGVGH